MMPTNKGMYKAQRRERQKQQEALVDEQMKLLASANLLLELDYLCILDFEATCNSGKIPKPQEIIEFPTLLMNVKTGDIESIFHHYIKPDVFPQLSAFCTELTGIEQATVDQGISIFDALSAHQQWLEEHKLVPWHRAATGAASGGSETPNKDESYKTFLYLTCGDWDLKTCLPKQLMYHGITKPDPHFEAWINVKTAFSHMYKIKPKGMAGMLAECDMELEGRHHSGIDDCKNIARICRKMLLEDGWKPQMTSWSTPPI